QLGLLPPPVRSLGSAARGLPSTHSSRSRAGLGLVGPAPRGAGSRQVVLAATADYRTRVSAGDDVVLPLLCHRWGLAIGASCQGCPGGSALAVPGAFHPVCADDDRHVYRL